MTANISHIWGRRRPPVSWFPGHMAKATRGVKERLKACDLVVEIRDARIPFSSINTNFNKMMENKPRLIIYNKVDLADPISTELIRAKCKRDGTTAMFLSAFSNGRGIQRALQWLQRESKSRFITTGTLAMVAGVPNVGKSTFINSIAGSAGNARHRRRRPAGAEHAGDGVFRVRAGGKSAKHLAKVGDRPGVTRALSSVLVSEMPLVRLLDTPGILVPKIENVEVGLRLALTGAVKDSVVGEDVLVAYMLDLFGRVQNGALLKTLPDALLADHGGQKPLRSLLKKEAGDVVSSSELALSEQPADSPPPVQTLEDVVKLVERASGAAGKADEEAKVRLACRFVLARFRAGKLGRVTLDDLSDINLPNTAGNSIKPGTGGKKSEVVVPEVASISSFAHGAQGLEQSTDRPLLYSPSDIF